MSDSSSPGTPPEPTRAPVCAHQNCGQPEHAHGPGTKWCPLVNVVGQTFAAPGETWGDAVRRRAVIGNVSPYVEEINRLHAEVSRLSARPAEGTDG